MNWCGISGRSGIPIKTWAPSQPLPDTRASGRFASMPTPDPVHLFFDYVDPASFLVERHLSSVENSLSITAERIPFEVRPPPTPMVDPRSPEWRTLWEKAGATALEEGVTLANPRLVPWTRKAHELALHAREDGHDVTVHRALFEAFLLEGRDIGRVDVLLEIAVGHGLDGSHTKAVLDVDRHSPMVTAARARAERLGVRGVPTLRTGDQTLEGLQSYGTILAFLQQAAVR